MKQMNFLCWRGQVVPLGLATVSLLAAAQMAFPFRARPATAPRFPVNSLAKQTRPLKEFCPSGWHFEQQIVSDLNNDSYKDIVAILISQEYTAKDSPPNRDRVLLVLLGCAGNKYRLADYSTKLVLCTACGGQLGANVLLSAKRHSFELEQSSGGGAEQSVSTYEFTYDSMSRQCILVRAQQDNNWDRVGCQGTRLTLDLQRLLSTINRYNGQKEKRQVKHVRVARFFLKNLDEQEFDLGKLLHVKADERPL
jgi:hypothetical protein